MQTTLRAISKDIQLPVTVIENMHSVYNGTSHCRYLIKTFNMLIAKKHKKLGPLNDTALRQCLQMADYSHKEDRSVSPLFSDPLPKKRKDHKQ